MAARRSTQTVQAPQLDAVPTGRGVDDPDPDSPPEEVPDRTDPGTDPIQALIKLHRDYRVPPARYVAKLNKTWTDRNGEKKSMTLDYVGHADATDILLRSDPAWTWEPMGVDERGLPAMQIDSGGNPIGLWIRLTVHGVTRIGYGTCPPKGVEGVKELIGDAIRNASMRFGLATALWSKSDMKQIELGEDGEEVAPAIGAGGRPPVQRTSAPPQRQEPDRAPAQPQGRPSGHVSRPEDRQRPTAAATAPPPAQERRPEPTPQPPRPEPAPAESGTAGPADDPSVAPVDPATATDLAVALSSLEGPAALAFSKYRRSMRLPNLAKDFTLQQAWDTFDFIEGLPKPD